MESLRSNSPKYYDEEERGVHKKRKLSDVSSYDTQRPGDAHKGVLDNFIKSPRTIEILHKKGIQSLFPIQYQTYKIIYQKNDLIARDRTGSGKTIAFSLPIIERFRAQAKFNNGLTKFLIVLPTRQLASQVKTQICSLKYFSHQFHVISVYGGTDINLQISHIQKGADIIVSTPGRLIDLLQRGVIRLHNLQVLCLDEADEMLRQGFQDDIEKIFEYIKNHTNRKTQNLLFSATIPSWVIQLSRTYLAEDRQFIDLIKNTENKTSKTIEHLSIMCQNRPSNVDISNVVNLYAGNNGRAIIFTQTKKDANEIGARGNLQQETLILHGDISQKQREFAFKGFKEGRIQCLVATNVAARGLDIPQVDIIVQVQPPKDIQTYIHRAGRTGRAGKSGVCVTFYNNSQRHLIDKIEKTAQISLKPIQIPSSSLNQTNSNNSKQINLSQNNSYGSYYSKPQFKKNERYQNRQEPQILQNYLSIPPPPPSEKKQISQNYSRRQYASPIKTSSNQYEPVSRESPQKNGNNQNMIPPLLYQLKSIPSEVLPYFSQISREVIQSDNSPIQMLAKMLAYIDRAKQQQSSPKSLLTGKEGLITYILSVPIQFQGMGYIFNFLKTILSEQYLKEVKDLKKVGQKQAAFDFDARFENDMMGLCNFLKFSPDFSGFSLEKASHVPSIQAQPIQKIVTNDTGQNYQQQISEQAIREAYRRRKQLQIYMGGLPVDMTEKQVNNFLRNRKILAASTKLLRTQQGDFRGVAFVICLNDRSLKNALNLNGQRLGPRSLKINIAANK